MAPNPSRPARLPPGRHTLSAEFVAASQRERLLAALAHLVATQGYSATTIAAIAQTASVSRRAFYDHFAGKEQCFLAAFDLYHDHLRAVALDAASPAAPWPERLSLALEALLEALAASPDFSHLCLIDALAAGPAPAARYREALDQLRPALAGGSALRGEPIPAAAEQALIGGALAQLTAPLAAGRAAELPALRAELLRFLLTPYLGGERAAALATDPPGTG